jgi:hypothetical protein
VQCGVLLGWLDVCESLIIVDPGTKVRRQCRTCAHSDHKHLDVHIFPAQPMPVCLPDMCLCWSSSVTACALPHCLASSTAPPPVCRCPPVSTLQKERRVTCAKFEVLGGRGATRKWRASIMALPDGPGDTGRGRVTAVFAGVLVC